MLVPRKRTPHGGSRRISRLTGAAVPASALAILAAVAVTACGSSAAPAGHAAPGSAPASAGGNLTSGSGLCAATAQVDSLTVQRTDALPGNHTRFAFPATEKVSSAPRVRAVAQSLCGLPQVPRKTVACPADFGVSYRLSFAAGQHRFAPVTVNAGGCELVSGLGGVRRAASSATLWRTLGNAVGIAHPGSTSFSGTSPSS